MRYFRYNGEARTKVDRDVKRFGQMLKAMQWLRRFNEGNASYKICDNLLLILESQIANS